MQFKLKQLGRKKYNALEKRARSYMKREDAVRQFMEKVAKMPQVEEEIIRLIICNMAHNLLHYSYANKTITQQNIY